MNTTARSIKQRTLSMTPLSWAALAALLIGSISLAACGPAESDLDPGGIAVSVPDSSVTTADAGARPDQPCTVDADCLSGSCVTSYRDRDGDGFGDDREKVTRCESVMAAGYAPAGGDCCDADPSTHPGVTNYSALPTACGGFDRNCDGRAERYEESAQACGCVGVVVDKLGAVHVCTACR